MQRYKYKYKYKKIYKPKKEKLIFRFRFLWVIILVLIILGAGFYFFIFFSFFQIEKIIVSGNEKISKEKIQAVVEDGLEKKILFFSTKSIFLVNSNKLEKDILSNFIQIAEIKVNREWPDTINILTVERLALANFCQIRPGHEEENSVEPTFPSFDSQNLEGQDENCFLLDKEGIIFGEGIDKAELIIKSEYPERQIFLGESVIGKKYIELILTIKKELEENTKIDIEEFIVFGAEKKLDVRTSEGWEIYFYSEENIQEQIFNLNLVLKEKISPEERGNLEYIDLRFGSRVYFKYKD